MFSARIHKLLSIKQVVGLQARILSDGKMEFSRIELKREKGSIRTANQIKKESEEELFENLKPKLPLVICISGKGILSKKLLNDQAIQLSAVLPGAKEEDFYIQTHFVDETHSLVSIVRKSQADNLLQKFKQNGFEVVDLVIGPPEEDTSMLNIGSLVQIKVDTECRIAFSASLNWLLGGDEPEWSNPLALQIKEEYRRKRVFKASSVAVLGVLFLVLLVNFLFFSHYNTYLKELSMKATQSGNLFQEAEILQGKLKEKESLLSGLGLMEPARQSYYADQLAKDLPEDIKLKSMNIFPAEKPE